MELYPAIDLRGGRVARVPPGSPDDPLDLLQTWSAPPGGKHATVRWVHLVDLDRANGVGENRVVVQGLLVQAVAAGGPLVQVGGGLASSRDVREVLGWGAARVVVGAALAARDEALQGLVAEHGADRLAVAVEVRDGRLAPRGQAVGPPPDQSVTEYVAHARSRRIRTFVYTDVVRDGMLVGPDVEGARRLARDGMDVIVGGGVGSLDDLKRVRAAGLAGAIVGRALHEGRFTLAQALACLAD